MDLRSLLSLPLFLRLLHLAAAGFRRTQVSPGCAAELVALSPCLPFISEPPNCLATAPSDPCCLSFSFYALAGGPGSGNSSGAACLCHLVRNPLLLGFPLNASRIDGLFGACSPTFASSSMTGAFRRLCQELGDQLPPFRNDTGSTDGIIVGVDGSNFSFPPVGAPPFMQPPNNETTWQNSDERSIDEGKSSIDGLGAICGASTLLVGMILFLLLVRQ